MTSPGTSLFIVFLRFGENRARAQDLMQEHVSWLQQGIDDKVFLCAGSLSNRQGGAIIAQGIELDSLEQRLTNDPFVREGVVTVEITPVSVSMAAARLMG